MFINKNRWSSLLLFVFLVFSIACSVCCTEQSNSMEFFGGSINAADSGLRFNNITEINDDSIGYSRGNSNGLIDAGEKIEMRISIRNFESFNANNVVLLINCTNPFVVIDVKQVSMLSITAGAVGTAASSFQFYLKTGIAANTTLTFNLNVTATEGQWLHQSFTAQVFGVPEPDFVRYKVYSEQTFERIANNDGVINAGERITADIFLRNSGNGSLIGASATLLCSDPFIGVVSTTNVSYSTLNLAKDGEKSGRYTFNVSSAVEDKRMLNFSLNLTDTYGTNYMIHFKAVVNGTPSYEVVNISISKYDDYYDLVYEDISKAAPDQEYDMNIYLRNTGTALGKIQRVEITCDDPQLIFTDSTSYSPYLTTAVDMGTIISLEDASLSFKIKSNTMKGHRFTIRVRMLDERTLEWSVTTYEFEYENGISLTDLLLQRSPTILLMSIAIIGGIILMIPSVKRKIGDRRKTSILRCLLVYLFFISLIIYLGTEISPYYFFGFLVLFYCTVCSAGLAKSGAFRNLGNAWEKLMDNISFQIRVRKQKRREKKERKRQEKEERRETLPRLIALASKQTESAFALEGKNDFKGARSSWTAALTAYQKISKKGKKQDAQEVPMDSAAILKNVDSVRCNLGLSYVHEGMYLKNQAKEKLKSGSFAVAAGLYQEAANCFKQAKEYFKKESDLVHKFPEDVNIPKIEESEAKYTKKATVYKIQDELEVLKRQVGEIGNKMGNKEKLIDLKNESNNILKRAQNLKFELEKQNITTLDAEMQSFLENLRSLQFKLDKKIDEMLGVVAVSKYSKIVDEEEDEEEIAGSKEPAKAKQEKEATSGVATKDAKEPEILREYEFLGGKVRFKVKLVNNTKEIFTDLKLTFTLPESLKWVAHEPEYPRKGDTIQIAKLGIQEQKTISLYLTPINCTGSPINATLTYFDSKDQPHAIPMKPKKVEISCPIFFTQEEANPARVKHLHQTLPIRDKKMLPIVEDVDINEQIDIAIKSITRHDVKFVEKVESTPIYEFWYFGTTKVKQKSMVIYLKIDTENSTMLIEVSGENHENITALLAEIEDQIRQEINSINPNYNEDSYLDVKTTIILGHCPYCFNAISPQAVKEYKSGKPIQCSYCKSDIAYYE